MANNTKWPLFKEGDHDKSAVNIAIDIESLGALSIHPVVSVGIVVGDDYGNILTTARFNITADWRPVRDGGQMEDRCWDEFWSKQTQHIPLCQVDAQEPVVAWQSIMDFIENAAQDKKTRFLTDNASFDIARCDQAVEQYLRRLPIRYSPKGKYRSIRSADDMYDMIPKFHRDQYDQWLKTNCPHCHKDPHNPVSNATHIYYQFVFAELYLE